MKTTEINKRLRELEKIARKRELTIAEEIKWNELLNEKERRDSVTDYYKKHGKVF